MTVDLPTLPPSAVHKDSDDHDDSTNHVVEVTGFDWTNFRIRVVTRHNQHHRKGYWVRMDRIEVRP